MADAAPDSFETQARIGRGIIPLAEEGRLVGEPETITLYKSRNRMIAQAPLRQVRAYRMKLGGLRLIIDGKKYNLDGGTEWLHHEAAVDTGDMIDAFLAWFEARGGNVGKP
jgi:hypothetical protein